MTDLIASRIPGYELIDSGSLRKLEQIAGVVVDRPSPQALWLPQSSKQDWQLATSVCVRTEDGGGFWQHQKQPPADAAIRWQCEGMSQAVSLAIRFTSFGHCGVFFEQEPIWRSLAHFCAGLSAQGIKPKAVNLFGYTGAASLTMAACGAEVFHIDSARGALQWGKDNVQASALADSAIRWIHDDARAFLRHSRKKDFRYHVILADPPSWGHGTGKEVWRFEQDLAALVEDCLAVLDPEVGGLVLTSHTPGVQHGALRTLLNSSGDFALVQSGDLGIGHRLGARVLPAGVYASASRGPGLILR
jgi:23S rRNA (cytosine1962-C5)-methyltransferase